MQFVDDLITRFVANYSQSYPVELPGLGVCTIASNTVRPSNQPNNAPWLRVSFTTGSTFNATIGTTATRLKREPFTMNVQILVPRTDNQNGTKYTYSIPATIERHLDSFLLVDGLTATGESGLIVSDQAEPKFKVSPAPTGNDTWRLVTISYQYFYQYV